VLGSDGAQSRRVTVCARTKSETTDIYGGPEDGTKSERGLTAGIPVVAYYVIEVVRCLVGFILVTLVLRGQRGKSPGQGAGGEVHSQHVSTQNLVRSTSLGLFAPARTSFVQQHMASLY